MYNSDNFCSACNFTFSSRAAYINHLRHKNPQQHTARVKIRYPDRIPDMYNSKNFCDPCQHTDKTISSFQQHIKNIHNIRYASSNFRSKIQNSFITPKIDCNSCYCDVCVHTFSSKKSYQIHMLQMHDTDVKAPFQRKQKRLFVASDTHDINNYCRVRDFKYKNKLSYRRHLHTVHSIKYKTIINTELIPKIGDPHDHWSVCGKSYASRSILLNHLFKYHPKTRPMMKKRYENYIRKMKENSENSGATSMIQKEGTEITDSVHPH